MTATKRPNIDHGKEFEGAVHDKFRSLYLSIPIHWYRIPDSFDSGNIVQAVDADFRLTIPSDTQGRPWVLMIECKSSIVHPTLGCSRAVKALVKPEQLARLRVCRRAGMLSYVFFESKLTGVVEVWPINLLFPKVKGWTAAAPATFNMQEKGSELGFVRNFLGRSSITYPA